MESGGAFPPVRRFGGPVGRTQFSVRLPEEFRVRSLVSRIMRVSFELHMSLRRDVACQRGGRNSRAQTFVKSLRVEALVQHSWLSRSGSNDRA